MNTGEMRPSVAEFPGFTGIEEVSTGERSAVFRAVRESDGLQVVLKTTRDTRPAAALVADYEREFRLASALDLACVPRYLERLDFGGQPVLVLDDVGGQSLDRLLAEERPGLQAALGVGLRIAMALQQLHDAGVLHKDLNPSNVVWSSSAGTLQVIDFGLATDVAHGRPAGLEGTLRYLAPEQSGRMNRTIDARSDLYALGCTLYELLSGSPPFDEPDPLALVHAHLAREPVPLAEITEVPAVVSDIVATLLRKAPEDRYQHAAGVVADLRRCVEALEAEQALERFALSTTAGPAKIRIPQRLYGRDEAVQTLLTALERTVAGGRETVLVGGTPGIGKTALVRELDRATLRRGTFVEGKFDQFRLGAPCEPVGNAFDQLVRRLLASPADVIATWRDKLGGPNAAVLAEIVPDLALLLGELPSAPPLPAAEAEARLHVAFREFVQTLTAADPLVLFLDDLQWADLSSLRLLEKLATDHETGNLLIVAAWRDNDVDAGHPLALTLERIAQDGSPPTKIELGPLEERSVTELVVDALQLGEDEAEAAAALAKTLTARTGGNPFFLVQLLETLGDKGIVRYDDVQGEWLWNLYDIDNAVPDDADIVHFLVDRLKQLPPRSLMALQAAACIGPEFDLRLLTELLGANAARAQEWLVPAVTLQLVHPRGGGYPLRAGDDDLEGIPEDAWHYSFVHDRVQQAAHDSLPPEHSGAFHKHLGQLLHEPERHDARGQWRFKMVNHLNRAMRLLDDDEKLELAEANLDAARNATTAAAFGAALDYAEAGIACLPDDAWQSCPDLSAELHLEAAGAAWPSARFERMDQLLAVVAEHDDDTLRRVQAHRIEIDARIAHTDLLGAIEVAVSALALLGFEIPAEPDGDAVGAAVGRAMGAVGDKTPADLAALPDATNARILAAQDILSRTATPAYYAVPALLPIVACEQVALSVEHGLAPASAFAFAIYGIILNSAGLLAQGHGMGELAETLVERPASHAHRARVRHVVSNLVCVWITPFQDRIDALHDAVAIGREVGDIEYAAIAAHCYIHNAWYGARDLPRILDDADQLMRFMRNYGQLPMVMATVPILRAIENMAGRSEGDPSRLDGPGFDEDGALAEATAAGMRSAIFIVRLHQALLRFHFGDAREAWQAAKAGWDFQDAAPSTYHLPVFHTYATLSALAVATDPETDEAARDEAFQHVEESLAQVRAWAEAGPMNHAHRLRLLEAAHAWATDDRVSAEAAFRDAIELAERSVWRNDAALTLEVAARFFMGGGTADTILGNGLLDQARRTYRRWGAEAKARHLEQEFPLVLAGRGSRGSSTLTGGTTSHDLDGETVVRAARAISAELELEGLLRTLFRLCMQSAGATAGRLLHRADDWALHVTGNAGADPNSVSLALDDLPEHDHPLSALRYVIRTGMPVLEDDVTAGTPFAEDPYLVRKGVRSILCVPVLRQGVVSDVLYLEHNTVSAFTQERVDVVQLLVAQAAISIENAMLYDGLEAKVRERTSQLVAAREKAEVASKAKSDFLGHMSHELRTPLNAILGYAQILLRQRELDAAQADGLQIIQNSGKHLLSLINDVLDMAKIEAGRFELATTEIDLEALCRGVIDVLELAGRRKGIKVEMVTSSWLPSRVVADERRLRQVLLNLVGNAVKFTEKGEVRLVISPLEHGDAEVEVRFEVRDTGPGISAEKLQAIFEPFEQAGGAASKARGTGLGLAISKQIVELMGGRLSVESTPGEGSTFGFTLTLPVASGESPEENDPARITGYEGDPRRILVVDDGRINRMVLLDLFAPLGFEVVLATNGQEAVDIATESLPDVVLMDLVMPVMNGFEATRLIRELPDAKGLPIYAVSASARDASRDEEELFDAFVVKPADIGVLLDLVEKGLGLTWKRDAAPVEEPASTPSPPETRAAPPSEELEALLELVLSGDLDAVSSRAATLAEADATLRPFAQTMAKLADDFDDEGAQALLEELLRR